jgi:hypothetical protein
VRHTVSARGWTRIEHSFVSLPTHLVEQGVVEPLVLSTQQQQAVVGVHPVGRDRGGGALMMGHAAGAPSLATTPDGFPKKALRPGTHRGRGSRREGAVVGGAAPARV